MHTAPFAARCLHYLHLCLCCVVHMHAPARTHMHIHTDTRTHTQLLPKPLHPSQCVGCHTGVTLRMTFPKWRPSSRRCASAASTRGYTLSRTGFSVPSRISFPNRSCTFPHRPYSCGCGKCVFAHCAIAPLRLQVKFLRWRRHDSE